MLFLIVSPLLFKIYLVYTLGLQGVLNPCKEINIDATVEESKFL